MGGNSLKAKLLRRAGRATMTVQTETPPYKYVMVEGPVVVLPEQRDDYAMASRYLGPTRQVVRGEQPEHVRVGHRALDAGATGSLLWQGDESRAMILGPASPSRDREFSMFLRPTIRRQSAEDSSPVAHMSTTQTPLGAAIAKRLAADGASVAITYTKGVDAAELGRRADQALRRQGDRDTGGRGVVHHRREPQRRRGGTTLGPMPVA